MNIGSRFSKRSVLIGFAAIAALLISSTPMFAQGLSLEGPTGIVITPLAYTQSAEGQKVHAAVGYHFVDAGPFVGNFHNASVTVGIGKRFEVGYTSSMHVEGLQDLGVFGSTFNIFHGKANVISENAFKTKWVPAVSVGFVARTQDSNVLNSYAVSRTYTNGKVNEDFYVVASKVVKVGVPFLLTAGERATNAELWGLAGNTANGVWMGRTFGSVAAVLPLPGKSSLVAGVEASQQPNTLGAPLAAAGVPGVSIPTSLNYFGRFTPGKYKKVNFDLAVVQVSSALKASHQFGCGVSYGF